MAKRCVIYARISVSLEASVSIERQVQAATQYAAARGWSVVGTFLDDGVSATHNKPERRPGWRKLLDCKEKYDAVVVLKVDRLARRVVDFLLAHEALAARGAAVVCVEQPIDMTTAQGRAFAQMLAVFAELEAAEISARVAGARQHLLRSGRVPGGTVPYGWRSVRNTEAPGYRLEQDPDRIDWVRGMVERAEAGDTLYSIQQWLDDVGAPTPTGKGSWVYTTVERILRHPLLAGMTPYNPGNKRQERGADVLRDADGLPVADEGLAVMPLERWRAMVRALDGRSSPQARPRSMKGKSSPLLSGLVWCEPCDQRMFRGIRGGKVSYSCPLCHQTITNFEAVVVAEFLRQKGERVRWTRVEEVRNDSAALLPEIEQRLAELTGKLAATDDDDAAADLTEKIARLRAVRREAKSTADVVLREVEPAGWFADAWHAAETVEKQREVLGDAFHRLYVRRGGTGRQTDATRLARLRFDWKVPEDLGPLPAPEDAVEVYGVA